MKKTHIWKCIFSLSDSAAAQFDGEKTFLVPPSVKSLKTFISKKWQNSILAEFPASNQNIKPAAVSNTNFLKVKRETPFNLYIKPYLRKKFLFSCHHLASLLHSFYFTSPSKFSPFHQSRDLLTSSLLSLVSTSRLPPLLMFKFSLWFRS